MKIGFFHPAAYIFLLLLLNSGCEEKHMERYEDPPWLGGSILETLESDTLGTYDIYYTLLEKAGYVEPLEKGLFTVFVANDEAFEKYFAGHNIASVDEISARTARNFIELNLLNSPRARHQLVYDYLWGAWQKEGSELGALPFRIPTRSSSNIATETVRYFPDFKGSELSLDVEPKWVPLFSTEFFRDYAGDQQGSDYTYFFPETEWSGLQWYNANIIRKEVRTSNGFIYYLDRPVAYIPSIEEYLRENQDHYGVFYDIMQRFATYEFSSYDAEGDYEMLYKKSYYGIDDLARETGPTNHEIYSRRDIWSIFVPTNDAMQQYLDENLLDRFGSVDSVPEVTLIYLLKSHMFSNFLLPSKMQHTIYDAFGDEVLIDLQNGVVDKVVLSNGAFFGTNFVKEPNAFKTVTAPLFFDKKYTTFLNALSYSGLIPSLTKPEVRTDLLVADDEVLEANGIKYDPIRQEVQKRESNGDWVAMSLEEVRGFVEGHMILQEDVDLSGEGFQQMVSGNYIHYSNASIQAGGNVETGDSAIITGETDSGINGILYDIDNVIKEPENDMATYIYNDPELLELFNLMDISGMVKWSQDPLTMELVPSLPFLNGFENLTAFLPDNKTIRIAQDEGVIPFTQSGLHDFIKYHFLIGKTVFDDGVANGDIATARVEKVVNDTPIYTQVTIENAPGNLQVTDHSGQVVSVDHEKANILVEKGSCHKISQVLLYQ
ncbi:MAG: hypothetical protein ABFS10_02750 [Bacteroidota bacterium]